MGRLLPLVNNTHGASFPIGQTECMGCLLPFFKQNASGVFRHWSERKHGMSFAIGQGDGKDCLLPLVREKGWGIFVHWSGTRGGRLCPLVRDKGWGICYHRSERKFVMSFAIYFCLEKKGLRPGFESLQSENLIRKTPVSRRKGHRQVSIHRHSLERRQESLLRILLEIGSKCKDPKNKG